MRMRRQIKEQRGDAPEFQMVPVCSPMLPLKRPCTSAPSAASAHPLHPLHHLPPLMLLQDRLSHLQLSHANLQMASTQMQMAPRPQMAPAPPMAPATVLTTAQLHGAGCQPPLKIAQATPAEASGVGVQSSFHSLQSSSSFDSDRTSSPPGMQGSLMKSMPAMTQLPVGLPSGPPAGPQNGMHGQDPHEGEQPGVQDGPQGGPPGTGLQGEQGGSEGAAPQLQNMLKEHGVQDLLQGLNDYKNMLAEYTTQLQTLQNQEMAAKRQAAQGGS